MVKKEFLASAKLETAEAITVVSHLDEHFDAPDPAFDACVVEGRVSVLSLLIHVEAVVEESLNALVLAVQDDQVQEAGAVVRLRVQDARTAGLVLYEYL